jgi:hypothetical protein
MMIKELVGSALSPLLLFRNFWKNIRGSKREAGGKNKEERRKEEGGKRK